MKTRRTLPPFVLALASLLALSGCGGSGGDGPLAERTAEAMGGRAALDAVGPREIVASGQWFEPEQTFRPGEPPLPVSTFTYTLTEDLAADRLRYDWAREVTYPFVQSLAYTEAIDGSAGYVEGTDGPAGPTRAALPSVRLATIRRLHRLSSPLGLIRSALAEPASVETRPGEAFEGKTHHVLALTGEPVSPVRLFVDPETFLPAKADTLEDDPYYGDTLHEVLFADWRSVGGVMVPFRLTERLTGLGRTVTIRTEERTSVRHDIAVAASLLPVPEDLRTPLDPADALRGQRMAQWFLRRQAIGLPSYADQALSLSFAEIRPGSGVYYATGGSHHTLIVEMADHLIALEPPLYESRSLAVIAAAKAAVPGKPLRHVVVSHFHVDHGGGVRAYAAEGATVVVGEAVREHFQAILDAPHTLVPDALAASGRTGSVTGVGDAGLSLGDGTRTVRVVPVPGQDHAAGYVLSHLSGEDLAFDSGDLFSPPAGTALASSLPAPLREAVRAFDLPLRSIAGAHGALAAVDHDVVALPTGFRPEGVAISGNTLFTGSIPSGRVFRADLTTGRGGVLVTPPAGRSAIGLKVDGRGRLFVAGGATGQAFVYDAQTGAELAAYTLAAPTTSFINDVVVTPQAAWFTDSRSPTLHRVPIGADGSLAAPEQVTALGLTGAFSFVAGVNNANGIAATPDGATLLIVQSNTGKLFTVAPTTGATAEILLAGGESVPNGDGILLQGQTLYVVQNRLNQVAVISLAVDLALGTVTQRVTHPAFDVPTTVAATDGSLWLPNARFGIDQPDAAEFSVVRIPKP